MAEKVLPDCPKQISYITWSTAWATDMASRRQMAEQPSKLREKKPIFFFFYLSSFLRLGDALFPRKTD